MASPASTCGRFRKQPLIRNCTGFSTPASSAANPWLKPDWVAEVIAAEGNYGEIYERNLGSASALKIARGLNRLWKHGAYYTPHRFSKKPGDTILVLLEEQQEKKGS